MASIDEAARYIVMETAEFHELIAMGVIGQRDEYDLKDVLRRYLNYLRRVIAGVAPDTPTQLKAMHPEAKQ